jgi:hypothetical protein
MSLQGAPIRFDRFQRGLIEVLTSALPSVQVAWAYGQGVFDNTFPSDFINLTISSGPNFVNRSGARGRALLPPALLGFEVDGVTAGARYGVTLNDFRYHYDAELGDTATDIRDALVAAIAADTESPYTVATTSTDSFAVTPSFTGAIWQASLVGALIPSVTLNSQPVLVTQGQRAMTVSMDIFSRSTTPRAGAWSLASKVQSILESQDYADILDHYGIGLGTKSSLTDLSRLDNGSWESRINLDVDMTMMSTHVRPVDSIETVNLLLSGSMPSQITTFTVTKP